PAHVGVEGKKQVADQELALGGLRHVGFDQPEVALVDRAGRPAREQDLLVLLRHDELRGNGGRFGAQGRARSSCAASRNRTASPPNGPTNCTPTGRPSRVQCSGTDMAGFPDPLNGAVKAMLPNSASRYASVSRVD